MLMIRLSTRISKSKIQFFIHTKICLASVHFKHKKGTSFDLEIKYYFLIYKILGCLGPCLNKLKWSGPMITPVETSPGIIM